MKKSLFAISALVASLAICGPVSAASFTLSNWNENGISPADLQVDVTTVGGVTQIAVYFVSDGSGLTALGIDKFGYDGVTATVASAPASWTPPPASEGFSYDGIDGIQMDGFGNFYASGRDPAGTIGTSSANQLVFTLSSDVTSSFTSGTQFVAHVRFGDCSGFVSGRTGGTSEGTGCGGTSVPEPASLLLLGAGLAGLGIWRRKQA